jgi:hypothetical protein
MKIFETAATADPDHIPTKAELHPPYKERCDQVEDLNVRSAKCRAELRVIAQRHRDRSPIVGGVDNARAARVAVLLGEAPPEPAEDDARRTMELIQEISDIQAAKDSVMERLNIEHKHASALVIAAVKEKYKKAVAAICDRLIEANRANAEFHRIVDALSADGVSLGELRAMHPHFIGLPQDKFNKVGCYVREAANYGLFPKSKIPSELST